MKFTKMQGIGNDYIYFDCMKNDLLGFEKFAEKLSDRHFGIGGDGIVLIKKSDVADAKMQMFNADGSEGKMCGNAIRCVGKYLFDNGYTDKKEIDVETLSGIKHLLLSIKGNSVDCVSVDMGTPVFKSSLIPVAVKEETVIDKKAVIGGKEYLINCVSMGNPHCVVFVDNLDFDISKIGPLFENDPLFPDRVNTEFVKVISNNRLQMRVWERGSGETLACGTGACAVGCVAVKKGVCSEGEITVELLGGELIITVKDDKVIMTGKAEVSFEGEIELDV
ncbi:MAG: diaminopimelate epimerase [Clostridia bacterium]|nr:diaminopimelate epimerase [Clostridia bacterium]